MHCQGWTGKDKTVQHPSPHTSPYISARASRLTVAPPGLGARTYKYAPLLHLQVVDIFTYMCSSNLSINNIVHRIIMMIVVEMLVMCY